MTKKREIERLIAKYRDEIAALEEREEHSMRRIEILQNILPSVLVWYMWKVSQSGQEPFPQHDTEQEARSKLEHLESVLTELQQADLLLKEEEQFMRNRINELEKSIIDQADEYSTKMIDSEEPKTGKRGKLYAQHDKASKGGYKSDGQRLAPDMLPPAFDKDLKTVCDDLTKQVRELREKLNNSKQKLKESEDYVKDLEDKCLTLEKELEEKLKLLGKAHGGPPSVLKSVEDLERKKTLSAVQEALAEVRSIKEDLSKSSTLNEDDNIEPVVEVADVRKSTRLPSKFSKVQIEVTPAFELPRQIISSSQELVTPGTEDDPSNIPAPRSLTLKSKDILTPEEIKDTEIVPAKRSDASELEDTSTKGSEVKNAIPKGPSTTESQKTSQPIIEPLEPAKVLDSSPAKADSKTSLTSLAKPQSPDRLPSSDSKVDQSVPKSAISNKAGSPKSSSESSAVPGSRNVSSDQTNTAEKLSKDDTTPSEPKMTPELLQPTTGSVQSVPKSDTLNQAGSQKSSVVSSAVPGSRIVSSDQTNAEEKLSKDEITESEPKMTPEILKTTAESAIDPDSNMPVTSEAESIPSDKVPQSKSSAGSAIKASAELVPIGVSDEPPGMEIPNVNVPKESVSESAEKVNMGTPSDTEIRKSLAAASKKVSSPTATVTKGDIPGPTENLIPTLQIPNLSGASQDSTKSVSKESSPFLTVAKSSPPEKVIVPDTMPSSEVQHDEKLSVTPLKPSVTKHSSYDSVTDQTHESKEQKDSNIANTSADPVASTDIAAASFDPSSLKAATPQSDLALQHKSAHDINKSPLEPEIIENGLDYPLQKTVSKEETLKAGNDKPLVTTKLSTKSAKLSLKTGPEEAVTDPTKSQLPTSETPIKKDLKEITSADEVLPTEPSAVSKISKVLAKDIPDGERTVSQPVAEVRKGIIPKVYANDELLSLDTEVKTQFKESADHPSTDVSPETKKSSANESDSTASPPVATKATKEHPSKEPPLKSAADETEGQAIVSEPMEASSTGITPKTFPQSKGLQQRRDLPDAPSLAAQTLQGKVRVKDHLIKSLADELRDLARNNVWAGSAVLEAAANAEPTKTYDFDRNILHLYIKGEEPENYTPTMQANEDQNSNPLAVNIVRQLNNDSLLIKWERSPSAEVVGFQIFLNGQFMYWVHSAKRNLALLHPLDLSVIMEINVSAIDARGRIVSRSITLYKPK